MQNDSLLNELLTLSHAVGNTPELVQGGGGNTSIKKGDQMYIKASGGFLSEMTEKSGFTIVDAEKIHAYYRHKELHEKNNHAVEGRAVAFINSIVSTEARPSMEVAMHAFLGRVVVHTHPVFVNVLNCLKDGAERVRILADNLGLDITTWVPYCNPGYNLATAIRSSVLDNQKMPMVFFLQNHGIIVTTDTVQQAIDLTLALNKCAAEMIHQIFSIPLLRKISDNFYFAEGTYDIEDLATPFFPDCVVYITNVISFAKNIEEAKIFLTNSHQKIVLVKNGGILYKGGVQKVRAMHETLCAQIFIAQNTRTMGTPHSLTPEDVRYIAEMETERYRESRFA